MFNRQHIMDRADNNETVTELGLPQRIWQRRRLFVAVLATVLLLTVVALIVLPVRYLATGSVIVADQEVGAQNNASAAVWAQKVGDPADLESQLLIIRSPRVMRLAMVQPGVIDAVTRECHTTSTSSATCDELKTDPAGFVDYVTSRYTIGAVGRSRVINISYTSSSPDVAQTMANALTTAFLDDQRDAASNTRETAASYLWKEVNQLNAELREADDKIQAFRRAKGLMRGATAPISSERLTSISQQLAVAESARADAAARLQEVKANQSRGASDAPSVLSSRSISDLKQQLTVISAQLASQGNVLGPLHPSLRALERERDLVQQRLTAEIASIAVSTQKTFDASDALVTSLRKQMEAVKSEVGSATSDEASIESMVRGTEIKRQQYAELYKRASELETERRFLLGNTKLVSLAELPNKPFFPKKIPFLAAGTTIGLLLAFAAALFGDRLKLATWMPTRVIRVIEPDGVGVAASPEAAKQSTAATAAGVFAAAPVVAAPAMSPAVTPPSVVASGVVAPAFVTPSVPVPNPAPVAPKAVAVSAGPGSELALVTGAPILAQLPVIGKDGSEPSIGAILAGKATGSLASSLALAQQDRSFQAGLRQLASSLFVAGSAQHVGKILVTTPGSSDGKTFLTLALAQHLASAGRRVLAIECDLSAPKFEAALLVKNGSGLQSVLLGEARPQDAVMPTSLPNLDVISAGSSFGSMDLLGRKQMTELLRWSEMYDVVLLDGPAPAVLMDVGVLARQVDGVLLAMRSGRFSIGEAVATTSAIKAAGGKVLGIALTLPKPEAAVARDTSMSVEASFRPA
jgi:uncharacterized protein involved in exopolysaccharide biosynthesis/Mrp family chromosome partitioning ATPase